MSAKVAFLGLGVMGFPMAGHLKARGYDVTVYNRTAAKAQEWVAKHGGRSAATPGEAAAGADFVAMCVGNDRDLAEVASAALAGMKKGAVLIDHTTASADSARRIFADAKARGIDFIDAPVSGGTGGAIAGTLTFMVGGSAAQLERARPLLEKMGANIFHAGAVGAGQTAKICNNMLLGILMVGTSEAIALGVANGLDPKVLSEIMRRSSGGNWALEKYNPFPGVHENAPASKGYTGGFGTDLMLKDLGLSQENATAVKASTPLGGMARAIYAAHSIAGHGGEDFSSVIKMLQKKQA